MADRAPFVQTPRADVRLETWKAIAAYLNRDIRTVQRWEKTEGLPVHRHRHARSATVYANPSELDAWWEQRRPQLDVPDTTTPAAPRFRLSHAVIALAAVLAVSATAIWWLRPAPVAQPETRRLWTGPDTDHFGSISPDGRLFAFASKDNDDLTIVELATGREERLTRKPPKAPTGAARAAAFSPDGKTVAFAWDEGSHISIRTVGSDGSSERVLVRDSSIRQVALAWSPDGRSIAAALRRAAVGTEIVRIDPASGTETSLVDTEGQELWRLDYSPDGRFLAFDVDRAAAGGRRRGVYVAPASGGDAVELAAHADSHYLLGWGSQGILYACDRTGAPDGWLLPMTEGRPSGKPELAMKGIGDMVAVGLSSDGALYYGRRTSVSDVFTATLDLEGGKVLAGPESASVRYTGLNASPDWSPDGKTLAYVPIRRRPTVWPSARVLLRTVDTGAEVEVSPDLETLEMLRWCPDGKTLIGVGFDSSPAYRVVLVNSTTGETRVIAESARDRVAFHEPICLSASRVLYKRRTGFTEPGVLVSRDLETGRESEILPSVYRAAVSPDGRRLLYSTFDDEREYIRVVSLEGKARATEVYSEPRAGRIISVGWDPSGRHALYVKRNQLYRVALSGGQPQELPLTMEALRELRVHPDGRRVAFTAGSSSKGELWVWRNAGSRWAGRE